MKVTIELSKTVADLLEVLSAGHAIKGGKKERVRFVLEELADHAQQGVYRPGAWERAWICNAFGFEWTSQVENGDPYGRPNCESLFQRPISKARKHCIVI
jgi:hypothetical protein